MFRIVLKLLVTAICFLIGINIFRDSSGNSVFAFILCFLGIAHWVDYEKSFLAKQRSTIIEKFGRETIIWGLIIIITIGTIAIVMNDDRPTKFLGRIIELISMLLKAR